MSLEAKKKWYLDYLLIIVGTGLMDVGAQHLAQRQLPGW